MEAADTLYGVSMGNDGVSKIVSRKMPKEYVADAEAAHTDGNGASASAGGGCGVAPRRQSIRSLRSSSAPT